MKSIMTRDESLDKEYLNHLEQKVEREVNKKANLYLVLYYASDKDSGEELVSWKKCYGRKETYDFIKNMIEYMDLEQSIVLPEIKDKEGNINILSPDDERALSAFKFMEHMKKYIDDPTFDINDYK